MPDKRTHRGPHPRDRETFRHENEPVLGEAVRHLSWLLTRGYAEPSSLKLVGDRFALLERQRLAVRRSCCADQRLATRQATELSADALRAVSIDIDGFNLLTTIEAALGGGVLLKGRDGCVRDMASMHGNYRKVAETTPALELIGNFLQECGVAHAHWWLDRPVSNSGRLKTIMSDLARKHGWDWIIELVPDPDPVLAVSPEIVVTGDSQILDRCARWCSLARAIVETRIDSVWIIDLSDGIFSPRRASPRKTLPPPDPS